MTRNNVFVGDRRVLRRYIGDKLIFDDLSDKTEILSGTEIFTDKADEEAVVHVGVDGKSYQHAGSGKNLFHITKTTPYHMSRVIKEGEWYVANDGSYGGIIFDKFETKIGKTYTISFTYRSSDNGGHYTITNVVGSATGGMKYKSNKGLGLIADGLERRGFITFTSDANENISISLLRSGTSGSISYKDIQIEESSTATEYEPPAPSPDYPIEIHSLNDFDVVSSVGKEDLIAIDKINLLLDEPLRSVGDIKDRLFKDVDGLWKVERNVGKIIFDGTQKFSVRQNTNTEWSSYLHTDSDIAVKAEIITSHYRNQYDMRGYTTREGQQVSNYTDTSASIIFTDYPMSTTEWKNKLINSPTTLLYEKKEQLIETLGQELQDKLNNLRTFKDSNYVYTVLPDKSNILSENLKPTLRATFKSIGWETFRKRIEQGGN